MSIIEQIQVRFADLAKLGERLTYLRNTGGTEAEIAEASQAWAKVNNELNEVYIYTPKSGRVFNMARNKTIILGKFRDQDIRLLKFGTLERTTERKFVIQRNFNGAPVATRWIGQDYYDNAADAVKAFYLASAEQAPTI